MASDHDQWESDGLHAATADVAAFHEKMKIGYDGPPRDLPGAPPSIQFTGQLARAAALIRGERDGELSRFRTEFLLEELLEYVVAVQLGKREDAFDALLDLIYVAVGTIYLHGFPAGEGWERVQRANLAKEPADDPSQTKRKSTHDVIKPPGWTPPDLSDLVAPLPFGTLSITETVEPRNDFDGSDGGPLPGETTTLPPDDAKTVEERVASLPSVAELGDD